jgi:hypothetical protein
LQSSPSAFGLFGRLPKKGLGYEPGHKNGHGGSDYYGSGDMDPGECQYIQACNYANSGRDEKQREVRCGEIEKFL